MSRSVTGADPGKGARVKAIEACPMCAGIDIELLARRSFGGKDYDLARCRHCGQHFCSPLPTQAEIAGFYEGDYHADLREPGGSEQLFGRKFEAYRDWLLEFITSGRSLDIGTATGLFPSLLKRAGFDAEGLEYNQASAQWGESHYGVKIFVGGLPESGLPKGSYDLITMTDVLEHTASPLGYLKTVHEYLRPRGFMLITFPDINSLESRWQHFFSRLFHRDWVWECCHIPRHVWEFTPSTARAMFLKAGFEVAGFRRSRGAGSIPGGKLALFFVPLRLLRLRMFERLTGTQMEFVIRRRD